MCDVDGELVVCTVLGSVWFGFLIGMVIGVSLC